ncbi:MAG TPA: Crp/Fnr family transcriptional regulator [Oscillospiraceae bacterium]|nr:Crp/Fnr family transcriptional regulator [Oscillospiraceae bacterium]
MIEILKNNKLFFHINEEDIPALLKCLGSHKQSYPKDDFIFLADESAPAVGILLSGKAQVIKENILGDSMIIGTLKDGDMFGETFACMGKETMPVSVVALEPCEVLLLDVGRIVHTCQTACPFHQQLISNLLRIMAGKNEILSRKMSFITHKTIRNRLEAFFYDQMEQSGTYKFTVPFNRNELADYLCIDRSAMCRELSHMKEDGILDYSGNNFHWLEK